MISSEYKTHVYPGNSRILDYSIEQRNGTRTLRLAIDASKPAECIIRVRVTDFLYPLTLSSPFFVNQDLRVNDILPVKEYNAQFSLLDLYRAKADYTYENNLELSIDTHFNHSGLFSEDGRQLTPRRLDMSREDVKLSDVSRDIEVKGVSFFTETSSEVNFEGQYLYTCDKDFDLYRSYIALQHLKVYLDLYRIPVGNTYIEVYEEGEVTSIIYIPTKGYLPTRSLYQNMLVGDIESLAAGLLYSIYQYDTETLLSYLVGASSLVNSYLPGIPSRFNRVTYESYDKERNVLENAWLGIAIARSLRFLQDRLPTQYIDIEGFDPSHLLNSLIELLVSSIDPVLFLCRPVITGYETGMDGTDIDTSLAVVVALTDLLDIQYDAYVHQLTAELYRSVRLHLEEGSGLWSNVFRRRFGIALQDSYESEDERSILFRGLVSEFRDDYVGKVYASIKDMEIFENNVFDLYADSAHTFRSISTMTQAEFWPYGYNWTEETYPYITNTVVGSLLASSSSLSFGWFIKYFLMYMGTTMISAQGDALSQWSLIAKMRKHFRADGFWSYWLYQYLNRPRDFRYSLTYLCYLFGFIFKGEQEPYRYDTLIELSSTQFFVSNPYIKMGTTSIETIVNETPVLDYYLPVIYEKPIDPRLLHYEEEKEIPPPLPYDLSSAVELSSTLIFTSRQDIDLSKDSITTRVVPPPPPSYKEYRKAYEYAVFDPENIDYETYLRLRFDHDHIDITEDNLVTDSRQVNEYELTERKTPGFTYSIDFSKEYFIGEVSVTMDTIYFVKPFHEYAPKILLRGFGLPYGFIKALSNTKPAGVPARVEAITSCNVANSINITDVLPSILRLLVPLLPTKQSISSYKTFVYSTPLNKNRRAHGYSTNQGVFLVPEVGSFIPQVKRITPDQVEPEVEVDSVNIDLSLDTIYVNNTLIHMGTLRIFRPASIKKEEPKLPLAPNTFVYDSYHLVDLSRDDIFVDNPLILVNTQYTIRKEIPKPIEYQPPLLDNRFVHKSYPRVDLSQDTITVSSVYITLDRTRLDSHIPIAYTPPVKHKVETVALKRPDPLLQTVEVDLSNDTIFVSDGTIFLSNRIITVDPSRQNKFVTVIDLSNNTIFVSDGTILLSSRIITVDPSRQNKFVTVIDLSNDTIFVDDRSILTSTTTTPITTEVSSDVPSYTKASILVDADVVVVSEGTEVFSADLSRDIVFVSNSNIRTGTRRIANLATIKYTPALFSNPNLVVDITLLEPHSYAEVQSADLSQDTIGVDNPFIYLSTLAIGKEKLISPVTQPVVKEADPYLVEYYMPLIISNLTRPVNTVSFQQSYRGRVPIELSNRFLFVHDSTISLDENALDLGEIN